MDAYPRFMAPLLLSSALSWSMGCTSDPEKSSSTDSTPPDEADTDTDTDVVPTFFAASDVDAATVDLISGAFSVADDVWFTEDAA